MELEIKFKLNKDIRNKVLDLGFKYIKTSHQIDNYYIVNEVFKELKTYLRIREDLIKNTSSFDLHQVESSIATHEHELDLSSKDAKTMKFIIEILGFSLKCSVDKKREVFSKENFKIVIDDVKNLGNFIEIEMEDKPTKENESKLFTIANHLGLDKKDIISNVGYPDLLLNK